MSIDKAEANGFNTLLTDDRCHFCLSYHLKSVYNTYCNGRHSYRPLSQSEFGRLGEWKEHFCGGDEAPPVREVDTGVQREVSTLSS